PLVAVDACEREAAEFRRSFTRRTEDERRELERLTAWAVSLCRSGVVELRCVSRRNPSGMEASLSLLPAGEKTSLFHVCNDNRPGTAVYLYSYSLASSTSVFRPRLPQDLLERAEHTAGVALSKAIREPSD